MSFDNNPSSDDFEQHYVHDTYEEIAKSFSSTRHSPWPSVKNYLSNLPTNSKVLDAGCGNGKNMLIRNDLRMKGCDTCQNLLKICTERGLDVSFGNLKALPFEDSSFDHVISIAVLHHLTTHEDREKGIKELLRVLQPGGTLLLVVWALEQKLTNKFTPINNENDFFVSWKTEDGYVQRYYHLFSDAEIENLVSKYSSTIVKKFFEKDNWVLILQKNL
jgi:ubiquinone/menaquinone biosynthesis C-methylase UbiE